MEARSKELTAIGCQLSAISKERREKTTLNQSIARFMVAMYRIYSGSWQKQKDKVISQKQETSIKSEVISQKQDTSAKSHVTRHKR